MLPQNWCRSLGGLAGGDFVRFRLAARFCRLRRRRPRTMRRATLGCSDCGAEGPRLAGPPRRSRRREPVPCAEKSVRMAAKAPFRRRRHMRRTIALLPARLLRPRHVPGAFAAGDSTMIIPLTGLDYVFACMKVNGETRDMLDRCSCSIDVIATLLPYDDMSPARPSRAEPRRRADRHDVPWCRALARQQLIRSAPCAGGSRSSLLLRWA